MSLQQWHENGWIRETRRSPLEASNLSSIAEREIRDASLEGVSADGRFDHAYSAVRTLCQLALHACGYAAPKGQAQHVRIIRSLEFTLNGDWTERVDFLERCSRTRHQSLYERSDVAQQRDADDLLADARKLYDDVRSWLQNNHPDLV